MRKEKERKKGKKNTITMLSDGKSLSFFPGAYENKIKRKNIKTN